MIINDRFPNVCMYLYAYIYIYTYMSALSQRWLPGRASSISRFSIPLMIVLMKK